MGILNFFSGTPPETYEQRGDAFVINRAYGPAKIEYEKALDRLDRTGDVKPGYRPLIEDKLRRCKESLAREHHEEGRSLAAAGCGNEARELLDLALELTRDVRLAAEINTLLATLSGPGEQTETFEYVVAQAPDQSEPEADPGSDEEYFEALCNSLDEAESDAYHQYPDTFKTGYIALNRGDFDTAVALLAQAARAYPFGANHITLELATAHLNRGENETARNLLEGFLAEYPDSLKAYYLMCEVLWETGAYEDAHQLLAACPDRVAELLPIKMLTGETLMQAGQHAQAADFYQGLLATAGWNDQIALALSGAYEALGRNEAARNLYAEIMGTCTECGTRVDPEVKQRYAETSFAVGDTSTKTLELYLDLVREDPANRKVYYQRISHIYALQGNADESRRFAFFAQRAAEEE
jgi:tetratricopeptide (TPR) repeat protein